MGLQQLEWHPLKNGGWMARVADSSDPARTKYRRYAHVNVFDWVGYSIHEVRKGKVPVQFQNQHGMELRWFDDVDVAKLHVAAVFALDTD